MPARFFVHFVTYNSAAYIGNAIQAFNFQSGYTRGENLFITVTDNCSTDGTPDILEELFSSGKITGINLLNYNSGFAAGQNLGAAQFIESGCDLLAVINPDLALEKDALIFFGDMEKYTSTIGCIGGKLLSAQDTLQPVVPPTIDSTGMIFTSTYRHFDRGNGTIDNGQYDHDEIVEGFSGACMFMTKEFVRKVSFRSKHDSDLLEVYPELSEGLQKRVQLFDEAFFAYREDADLCLRARNLGLKFKYYAQTVGYHVRKVTPERRGQLHPEINRMSVRNRFLLQFNNFRLEHDRKKIIPGLIIRNLIVVAGVVLKERTSIKGLKELFLLLRRSIHRNFAVRS